MSERSRLYSRREMVHSAGNLAALLLVGAAGPNPPAELAIIRPKVMGVSFSQLQCSPRYLDMDYQKAFREICSIEGLTLIRLAPYINEINSETGFKHIDWMVDYADKKGKVVVINTGAKQFRWPENHLTRKTKDRLELDTKPGQILGSDKQTYEEVYEATGRIVDHLKDSPAVMWWQNENEPHDSFGGHTVAFELVKAQQELIMRKKRQDQNVLVTGSFATKESFGSLKKNIALQPKAIGFNIYTERPNQDGTYTQMDEWQYSMLSAEVMLLESLGIGPWCTEAQAEPWKNGYLAPYGQEEYSSTSPAKTKTLCSRLSYLGIHTQLLWGAEFWVKQQQMGFPNWMKEMRNYFAMPSQAA